MLLIAIGGRCDGVDANPASPLANGDCIEDLPQELNFDDDSVQYAWLLA